MRILLLGNPYNRDAGARSFGFAMRFYNGLVRAGHMVHFYADRDEARHHAPLFGSMKKRGAQKANQKFLKVVDNIRPEAVIFAHVGVITHETMQEVRRKYPDIRAAYLTIDALFCPSTIHNCRRMSQFCDDIFVPTGGEILNEHSTTSCRFHFMPNITDRSMDTGRAFELDAPTYDIASFMHGEHNLKKDHVKRVSLADEVARIEGIKTFYRGFGGLPGIYGFDYLDAIGNSAMTLSLNRHSCDGVESCSKTRYMYSSSRIGHAMGNGSMAFVQPDFNLQSLYTPEEVVFFEDGADLLDKIRFYKNNISARQKIARAGWEKAHRDFNEEVVMSSVIKRSFNEACDMPWEK